MEKLDMYAIEVAKRLLTLRDYKNDGVLSYCDTADLESLVELSKIAIDKLIIARSNKNQKILQIISAYELGPLMDAASADFYTVRETFSKCYYYLTHLNKQLVHFTENVSLIPGLFVGHYVTKNKHYTWPSNAPINIIDDEEGTNISPSIRDKFAYDNTDIDMYLDKLINVFYQYFDFGHQLMNDADAIAYSFSLLSAVSSGGEKRFYDFLKSVGVLLSSFVVFDRINQLKKELNVYEMEKQYYLIEHDSIPAASWLNEPRKSNIADVIKMLDDDKLESDTKRFNFIIKKHLDYLKNIQYLDPNLI